MLLNDARTHSREGKRIRRRFYAREELETIDSQTRETCESRKVIRLMCCLSFQGPQFSLRIDTR
jgi:hypothetical protein